MQAGPLCQSIAKDSLLDSSRGGVFFLLSIAEILVSVIGPDCEIAQENWSNSHAASSIDCIIVAVQPLT